MNRNLILCIATLLIAMTACNKQADKAVTKFVTSDTAFVLSNTSSKALQVTLYTSQTDMTNGTNAAYTALVPAKNVYKIPFGQIDTSYSTQYYYDIHTPDNAYSNWGNYVSYGYPLFYSGHTKVLDTTQLTRAQYYFLNSNNTSVVWKAVDKLSASNTSVWSTLDANAQYMQLVLTKAQTGSISSKYATGQLQVDNIETIYWYQNSPSGNDNITMQITTGSSSSRYSVYNAPMLPDYNISHKTSKDTIILSDSYYYNYWVMVRQ